MLFYFIEGESVYIILYLRCIFAVRESIFGTQIETGACGLHQDKCVIIVVYGIVIVVRAVLIIILLKY